MLLGIIGIAFAVAVFQFNLFANSADSAKVRIVMGVVAGIAALAVAITGKVPTITNNGRTE